MLLYNTLSSLWHTDIVNENNIGAPKMFGDIKLVIFPYCDSNIGFFSIVSCIAIALNLLCFFSWLLSFNYRYSNSYRSFLLLESIAISLFLLFAICFKSEKEQQLLLYVALPTIFERAKQKRSWTAKISFRYFPFFIQNLVNCLILKIIYHQIKSKK